MQCIVGITDFWEKEKLGPYALKRVAAGAHPSTPWLFEPAKRTDDGTDYCLDFWGPNGKGEGALSASRMWEETVTEMFVIPRVHRIIAENPERQQNI